MPKFAKETVLLFLINVLFIVTGMAQPVVNVGVSPCYQTVKILAPGATAEIGVNVAQYSISATCDPKSLKSNEVEPVDESWTCSLKSITPLPNATENPNTPSVPSPSGGNGS